MPTAHLIIRLLRERIALSALGCFRITFLGELPQARNDTAPLALNAAASRCP
jgi:hypothetical protein